MARWLFFAIFLIYYVVLAVRSHLSYDSIVAGVLAGQIPRKHIYYSQMAGLWIPSAVLLLLAAFGIISLRELGLHWVYLGQSAWLTVVSMILYIAYLTYLFFSLRRMKRNAAAGKAGQSIPERVRALYPATKADKRVWMVAAFSVGITEELLFRGFLIGSAHLLFPSVPIVVILVLASMIFGAGHLYQGARRVAVPTLLGFLLGMFFISFGSILPGILVHILQDIGAVYVMEESPLSPAGGKT